jgi:hypothetical protein
MRTVISWIVGSHYTYSYYNRNSYWSTSNVLMTSKPCTLWWSQCTTPHTVNSRSVHFEQARQQHHNRKYISICDFISIIIHLHTLILWYLLTGCTCNHHKQLLLFLSILIKFKFKSLTFCRNIIVCNFSKECTAPWGWHYSAESCRCVPYNVWKL